MNLKKCCKQCWLKWRKACCQKRFQNTSKSASKSAASSVAKSAARSAAKSASRRAVKSAAKSVAKSVASAVARGVANKTAKRKTKLNTNKKHLVFCFRAAFFCRLFSRPFFGCFPELFRAMSGHKFGRNISKDNFGPKSTDTSAVCIEYLRFFARGLNKPFKMHPRPRLKFPLG